MRHGRLISPMTMGVGIAAVAAALSVYLLVIRPEV